MNLMMNNADTHTGIPSGKLGMWVFLASEVMLFGGFISAYVILRAGSDYFPMPPREMLGVPLATLNTFVLISSSVTMVLALDAIQKGNVAKLKKFLAVTIALACCFLAIKSYEYPHKWHEGITISSGLFGSFYYTMTGLHMLHVLGGIGFIGYLLMRANQGRINEKNYARVEYAGLYWHFVDLVWVILFPIFYLL